MEEEEEDSRPQLYRQFTSECSKLASFYFGFRGGKEKEKEKGKEKEKEKGKESEAGNHEDEEGAEELDLSLENQRKRRKALIQLIRNGTTFVLQVGCFFFCVYFCVFCFGILGTHLPPFPLGLPRKLRSHCRFLPLCYSTPDDRFGKEFIH